MKTWKTESLIYDPVHGYIPFTSREGVPDGEVSEEELIDDPWVQRLRQIHQLQTAWWVFPTAEHTRFQHVLGTMFMASRVAERLYESLHEVCDAAVTASGTESTMTATALPTTPAMGSEQTPSRGYVESLLRIAALLHDVGHGPFGHFFDDHFLKQYGLTHETLGAIIIDRAFGEKIRRIRRNPNSELLAGETIDPEQVAFLIQRPNPTAEQASGRLIPQWLRFLRTLFCGLYTVDNMDFVLRDAYMSGFANQAFDLERLLRYTAYTPRGLTIHERGFSTLIRFLIVRSELFRTIYYHRMVQVIDLELETLFQEAGNYLFDGNPAEHLQKYQNLTEWSLLVDLSRWAELPQNDPRYPAGQRWRQIQSHQMPWKMVYEKSIFFTASHPESTSIFRSDEFFENYVREALPETLCSLPLRFKSVKHNQRSAADQNFFYNPATNEVESLTKREQFCQLPVSWKICRIYAQDMQHAKVINDAINRQLGGASVADDLTNM
ncbi:MAG: HD domain-containing protein [Thermoguttaceae bacterium]|nr:HD domain-containing protein [Thermoguttaceae bacterium]